MGRLLASWGGMAPLPPPKSAYGENKEIYFPVVQYITRVYFGVGLEHASTEYPRQPYQKYRGCQLDVVIVGRLVAFVDLLDDIST